MTHLDPLAMGFMDASDGISGTVDSVVLDASGNGTQMHVKQAAVDRPEVDGGKEQCAECAEAGQGKCGVGDDAGEPFG